MLSGPYRIQKLEKLAADEEFVHAVHELVRALFAASAVNEIRHVAPLLQYGPDAPGTAIRLRHLPQFAELDAVPDLADKWMHLVARLQVTADA